MCVYKKKIICFQHPVGWNFLKMSIKDAMAFGNKVVPVIEKLEKENPAGKMRQIQ